MESVEGSVFNTDEITLVLFGLHKGNLDERGDISIKSSEATYRGCSIKAFRGRRSNYENQKGCVNLVRRADKSYL